MKSLNSKMNLLNSRKMKTPSFRTNPTSNMSNDTLTFDHAEEKDGTMYYYPKESYMQKHAMIENNELQRSLREALIEYERQNKPSKHFKCRPVTIKRENKEPQTQIRCYEDSTTSATTTVTRDDNENSALSTQTTSSSEVEEEKQQQQQDEEQLKTVSFGKKHKHKNKKHHHHSYYYAESSVPFKSICGDNGYDEDDETTINSKWCKYCEVLPNNVLRCRPCTEEERWLTDDMNFSLM